MIRLNPMSVYITSRRIGALRLCSDPSTGREIRAFCQLEAREQLRVVAEGYDERTVLCRRGQCLYFVFREDLGLAISLQPARLAA